jgi:hypothetical protein
VKIYLGSVRQWHWISSALCLIGMLLFAVTGITLNHAAQIQVEPKISTLEVQLPAAVLQQVVVPDQEKAPLPALLSQWLNETHGIEVAQQRAEWSEDEIYLSLPRPGGDAWLSIDLASGDLLYEKTDRGWVSYFNDLHKGRNTGLVWFWFIDVFSVACIIFCVTGLVLLHRHAGNRPTTWPMVGLGFVVPLILIILFIH